MNFKKAFSLIEMLIVMIIVGILVYYSRNIFSYKNIEKVKFDTCYIHTYSRITKFLQDALLQKMVYTGNKLEKVNLYQLDFDITKQKIEFIYSGNKQVIKTISYNGEKNDVVNKCYTPTYHALLSGQKLSIRINPGLQTYFKNDYPIKLYTGGSTTPASMSYTGTIYMYYCQGNDCKEKYKLSFIPSTYLFTTSYCINLDTDGKTCKQWSE